MTRITALAAVLALALLSACEREETCPNCPHAATPAPAPAKTAATTPPASTVAVAPWETADAAFNGCAGGCGLRVAGPTEGVLVQPGAVIGQRVYCLISGVVFEVKPTSVQRVVGGKTLYFCCEACAQYFTANQARILALRGIAA